MSMFSKKELLVIGGVHIDILADYSVKDKHKSDKVGNISFSIGGTAFNLIANLVHRNIKISLCTVLNEDSQFTPHIFYKMREMKVSPDYIQTIKSDDLSAFVALREEGELVSAVTSNLIEKSHLEYAVLEKAISEHELVVADCNLSAFQLSDILKICNYRRKPVIIAVVSDSKVERICNLDARFTVDLVAMNIFEAMVFFGAKDQAEVEERLMDKRYSNFQTMVVTLGKEGFMVKTAEGNLRKFPAHEIGNVRSSTGAGDALLACIIYSKFEDKQIDWDKCYTKIGFFLKETLSNSTASYNSLIFLNRIIKRRRKKINKSLIVAIIGILVTAIIGTIQILLAAR